jgi:hypothetical protein
VFFNSPYNFCMHKCMPPNQPVTLEDHSSSPRL